MATQEKREYTEQKKTLKQPSPSVPGEARLISLCPQTRLGSCGQPMASVCAKSRVGWTRGDGDARGGIRALCSSPGAVSPGGEALQSRNEDDKRSYDEHPSHVRFAASI